MNFNAPLIDPRKSQQIYEQARKLATIYCKEWGNAALDNPDRDDPGIVMLRLFSRLSEIVIGQINRIPEKHLLAFYDFIGIDHLPPSASRAYITFKLSEGSKGAIVPVRTKVSSTEDPAIVFETVEPLSAVNFKIKAAYSLNPWGDTYKDHVAGMGDEKEFYSEGGFPVFDGAEPVPHVLSLSDDLFGFQSPAGVSITFTLSNYDAGHVNYFKVCTGGNGNPLLDDNGQPANPSLTPDDDTKSLTANFSKNVVIPVSTIDGVSGNWISFKPNVSLSGVSKASLPTIKNITCEVTSSGMVPDAALFNNAPVDVKKGFYPFGETPKRGDTFYIGCEEAFSKAGASVTLSLDLLAGIASYDANAKPLKLVWEYWNGSVWKRFAALTDNTGALTSSEKPTVVFTCPNDIKTSDINGVTSRWIRVRIDTGGYGRLGGYDIQSVSDVINTLKEVTSDQKAVIIAALEKNKIALGGKYEAPSFNPPFIHSVSIQCTKTFIPSQCKTYNNFEFKKIVPASIMSLAPFTMQEQTLPSFYIGIDDYQRNAAVSLYFSQKSRSYGEARPIIKKPDYSGKSDSDAVAGLTWKYFNGKNWTDFSVEDGTDFFTKNGVVLGIMPSTMQKTRLFGVELYWLKVELKDGSWYEPPVLKGVFPNTVLAENATVVTDELMGSSNGQANQVFDFSSRPLLEKQVIEILEPGAPSEDEMAVISREEGKDAVRLLRNDAGDVQEVWVQWHEVTSFVHSSQLSRHYVIDRINGRVFFGDGVHGMIPPAMQNNVVARAYKSGGGKKGDRKANTLCGLKTTIPYIDSATNRDAASGGRDVENIGAILTRSPHSIKNRGRAVTKEDFEWLAKEASPNVSRARCIRNDKTIQVIIAPAYSEDAPNPEAALTDYVETYLQDRAFAMIRNDIEVIGPSYKSINIEATVIPVLFAESAIVADRIEKRLKGFLHPITGGQDGRGWDFGRAVFVSEVASVIEGVDGVDYVKKLYVKSDNKTVAAGFIFIGVNELPCAGKITVLSEKEAD